MSAILRHDGLARAERYATATTVLPETDHLDALDGILAELLDLQERARKHVRHCRRDAAANIAADLEACAQTIGWALYDERAFAGEH